MKIRISKTKWNQIGRFAGWVKTDELMNQFQEKPPLDTNALGTDGQTHFNSKLSEFDDLTEVAQLVGKTMTENGVIDGEMEEISDFSSEEIEYLATRSIDENNILHIEIQMIEGSIHVNEDNIDEPETNDYAIRFHIHMIIKFMDMDGNEKKIWDYKHDFENDNTPKDIVEYLTKTIEWVENNPVKDLQINKKLNNKS